MEFSGQNSISVDGAGNLVLETILGNHTQQKAKVYTMNNTTGALTLLNWQPNYTVNGNAVEYDIILIGVTYTEQHSIENSSNII